MTDCLDPAEGQAGEAAVICPGMASPLPDGERRRPQTDATASTRPRIANPSPIPATSATPALGTAAHQITDNAGHHNSARSDSEPLWLRSTSEMPRTTGAYPP
jgi:hypothetical protein